MHDGLRELMISTLAKLDIGVMRLSRQKELEAKESASFDLALLMELPEEHTARLLRLLRSSRSQFRQDLFVLSQVDFKREGYFVEFGATNGVHLSNTCLLEKEFGWSGILAEPGKRWHEELKRNRSCHVETDCVWKDSNSSLTFNETEIGEYSTIDDFSGGYAKRHAHRYKVNTISLADMLEKYDAPRIIDYMSIDTEGSEFAILSAFDFDRYKFNFLTVEHNYSSTRQDVLRLLTAKGYRRTMEHLMTIEDWYVREQ